MLKLINVFTKFIFLLLPVLLFEITYSQNILQDIQNKKLLKGFNKRISGEVLNYSCFNPLAKSAILTRCTTGEMKIEWETEPIPADYSGEYIYFVWVVSYSTATSSGNRNFNFSINNNEIFVLRTIKDKNDKEWFLKADDGSELAFKLVQEDFVKDANGYMYLKVPAKKFKKGEPLMLKVVGERARVNDWFMTFMYDMRDRSAEVLPLPFLMKKNEKLYQSIFVGINILNQKGKALISINDSIKQDCDLIFGYNNFELTIPAVKTEVDIKVNVIIDGSPLEEIKKRVKPVRELNIYLLPHAHVDIGYTDLQPDVLKKHVKNIYDALDLIKKSSKYPLEAKFKWNVEVLWAVEEFLKTASDEKRSEFIAAIKNGDIGLQGLYLNMLTGLMRPEEFYKMMEFAGKLNKEYGFKITSAMISDIPGMTWNMIPVLAECGIKYFSSGPNGNYNGGDRTGYTNSSWADKPFYWVSPSGSKKILYWMTGFGYGSLFQNLSSKNINRLDFLTNFYNYFEWLDKINYSYNMIHMRHTINGDNGTVDPDLPDNVIKWNEKYYSPKICIGTSDEVFQKFEKQYGRSIPSLSGEFSPYWEDGAASTASELGITRITSEKLIQTEALYAMLAPGEYDENKFYSAWKNVLLFDEHTWGASNSISDPDNPEVTGQWKIKQKFAYDGYLQAENQYNQLFQKIIPKGIKKDEYGINSWERDNIKNIRESYININQTNKRGEEKNAFKNISANKIYFEVINTNSWERTDLANISNTIFSGKGIIKDEKGNIIPSQILSDGNTIFIAKDIPPFGSRRYSIESGNLDNASNFVINRNSLKNDYFEILIDSVHGSIKELKLKKSGTELVDRSKQMGLNEYIYIDGVDPNIMKKADNAIIRLKENGPLMATLLIESNAPGCNNMKREISLINGLERVEIINIMDKKMIRTKESVHFGFPFNIPDGIIRIDLGYGVFRPELDQLAGSCKDYYSAQRWIDLSNNKYGITFTVSEAPLIEIKDMKNEDPVSFPLRWKKFQDSSTLIYSYVMNNYWHTNYKADQEGISTYRYTIIPHSEFNATESSKLGINNSQPLILRQVSKNEDPVTPVFKLDNENVIVTYLKPTIDKKGCFFRLYNTASNSEEIKIKYGKTKALYFSSPFEEKLEKAGKIILNPNEIVSLILE